MGNELTSRSLNTMFDAYASHVLRDYLTALPRERGKMRKYTVIAPLPTKEEYYTLKRNRYKTSVGELVSNAIGDLESLRDELQEWYDNLPENFQQGDKGDQLEEALSNLDSISEPDIPENYSNLDIVFYPGLDVDSRSSRRDEAVSMLETVKDTLEEAVSELENPDQNESGESADSEGSVVDRDSEISELQDAVSSIEEVIDNAQNTEFPGMF